MVTDTHHHIIPQEIVDYIRKGDSRFEAEIQIKEDQEWIVHRQGYAYPLFDKFYKAEAKLHEMKKANIDRVVLSPAPPMFYYWLKPETAAQIARIVNDGVAEMKETSTKFYRAMATVSLQDPDLAVKEMERVKDLYGIQCVEIGTSIEGVNLDDPRFLPFFEAADDMGFTLFLHPYYVGDKQGLSRYYFTNLVGNPLDTATAAGSLIFSGILDRFKKIKILLAHGGGYFPYQIGRLDKGYEERKESRTCEQMPSSYLNRFYYDTLTFNRKSLEFLVNLVGEDRVVLGSDYPFDMGTNEPCKIVNECNFSDTVKDKILNQNIHTLFNDN